MSVVELIVESTLHPKTELFILLIQKCVLVKMNLRVGCVYVSFGKIECVNAITIT